MPSSSFFSGTNPTPTEYENAVDLVAQASAQATAALASANTATTASQSAQGYSVSAGTSATTATTQAASASTSATAAAASQAAAATSATAASSSATAASTSASNAATSATNAANSATSASGSATSASTYATNAANSATAAATSASSAAATLAASLTKTNNLSDLSNATTARSNLGVAIGSNVQAWDADLDAIAAISSTSGLLKKTAANTWSLDTTSYHSGTLGLSQGGTGATDATGARSNLGLGTAATAAATSFAQVANNLSDLVSASTARSNLGLGSVATLASTAVLQSANNLSDVGNVTTARSSLGLGSLATLSSVNNSNWSGTQLSVANGGTGLTSLTAGYIPYGNGTGAFGSSSGLSYDGANLTTANADGYNGLRVTNTSGKLRLSGYLNSTFGAYIDGLNAAESAYIPLTLNGSTFILATSGSERMRIASDGSLLIGTTSNYSGGIVDVEWNGTASAMGFRAKSASFAGSGMMIYIDRNTTNDSCRAYSYYNVGASGYKFFVIDSGKVYSTDTSIGSISDVRHKENIRELEQGLDAILSLKPRRFDWKANKGTGKKNVAGFVAQEVEPIFPDLIDPWKDDEITDLKALSMGGMVPAIVKAIQELAAKVTALEAANG